MGFVARILLIYLPEEWAFRVFCTLMDEQKSDLRKLYLPGLKALKMELWKLEWLLDRHCPLLLRHLQQNGVGGVLYASQWYLTCFACPFNETFAARVLDMIIVEESTNPLPKLAFAVLTELGEELLKHDNLEDILTAIKVKPLSWDITTIRTVMSSALDSPVSQQDIDLAEEIYNQLQDDQCLGNPGDSGEALEGNEGVQIVNDLASSSSKQLVENGIEAQQSLIEHDLALMLSIDLLIDIENRSEIITTNQEQF